MRMMTRRQRTDLIKLINNWWSWFTATKKNYTKAHTKHVSMWMHCIPVSFISTHTSSIFIVYFLRPQCKICYWLVKQLILDRCVCKLCMHSGVVFWMRESIIRRFRSGPCFYHLSPGWCEWSEIYLYSIYYICARITFNYFLFSIRISSFVPWKREHAAWVYFDWKWRIVPTESSTYIARKQP